MQICAAQIYDFRNLTRISTDFSAGINLIHGSNAQGKTNLLEALCMLVTGSPGGRRRFMDLLLSQLNSRYFYHLQGYDRALRQCNALLKTLRSKPHAKPELPPWQELMATHGSEIILMRRHYLERVATLAAQAYARLVPDSEQETLTLAYAPHVSALAGISDAKEGAKILLQILAKNTEDDIVRGAAQAGPHRDDIQLRLHERSVQDFASQGQQRTTVIALKQAELVMLTEYMGEPPVLMLDDLLSELDDHRRRSLIDTMPQGVQTFITTTDAALIQELPKVERVFRMDGGCLID